MHAGIASVRSILSYVLVKFQKIQLGKTCFSFLFKIILKMLTRNAKNCFMECRPITIAENCVLSTFQNNQTFQYFSNVLFKRLFQTFSNQNKYTKKYI